MGNGGYDKLIGVIDSEDCKFSIDASDIYDVIEDSIEELE